MPPPPSDEQRRGDDDDELERQLVFAVPASCSAAFLDLGLSLGLFFASACLDFAIACLRSRSADPPAARTHDKPQRTIPVVLDGQARFGMVNRCFQPAAGGNFCRAGSPRAAFCPALARYGSRSHCFSRIFELGTGSARSVAVRRLGRAAAVDGPPGRAAPGDQGEHDRWRTASSSDLSRQMRIAARARRRRKQHRQREHDRLQGRGAVFEEYLMPVARADQFRAARPAAQLRPGPRDLA